MFPPLLEFAKSSISFVLGQKTFDVINIAAPTV
jgi:hypothetical protein